MLPSIWGPLPLAGGLGSTLASGPKVSLGTGMRGLELSEDRQSCIASLSLSPSPVLCAVLAINLSLLPSVPLVHGHLVSTHTVQCLFIMQGCSGDQGSEGTPITQY